MIDIAMPALSPTMEKGTLAKWLVKEGDMVRPGDLIAEIETDKATMEFEAIEEGRVQRIVVPEGTDDVAVGTVIAVLADEGAAVAAPEPVVAEPVREAAARTEAETIVLERPAAPPPPRRSPADRVRVSPLAGRIAAALDIDLAGITGSGPNGRIVRADLGLPKRTVAEAAPVPVPTVAAPDYSAPSIPHEAIKLSAMRKTIARRLTEAKQTVPHFYLAQSCRIDALLALRSEMNAQLAGRGIKLSVNDFLVKALAAALRAVPDANVRFGGDTLYRFGRADISMAVAVEGGLVTPVIENADALSISAVAQAARRLAERAREGKLQPAEYEGGSASISNLGMYGIGQILPVINPPQAMILGVGAAQERPIVLEGAVVPATMLDVTASFDHRAIDGATGAELMAAFKRLVEAPLDILA